MTAVAFLIVMSPLWTVMVSGEEKVFFFYVVDLTKPQIAHSLPNE